MTDYIIIVMAAIIIILLIILLFKKQSRSIAEKRDVERTKLELTQQIDGVKVAVYEQRAAILKEQLELQERVSNSLADSVGKLQQSNEQKLEQMRLTVDEKLTDTLSRRLDSSFKAVGEQLNKVYESLGKMQELSGGVTDLQRLLTNVKARGTWAEVRLGEILEQILTAEQYEQNVSVKGNMERVEFAIKIPSKDKEGDYVYLPIDSKFPQEDYLRLSAAAETGDKEMVEQCAKALERVVKSEAATINKLYIDVPKTTDFAIMFLPTEGLYAEVLRRQGLVEEIQSKYRVMICGPTTITAFLNTLRMGFRTIALDRRAAEVWAVLGAAKQQYERFDIVLEKAKRKLDEASTALDDAQKRNVIIRKKLKGVEELPAEDAMLLLDVTTDVYADED